MSPEWESLQATHSYTLLFVSVLHNGSCPPRAGRGPARCCYLSWAGLSLGEHLTGWFVLWAPPRLLSGLCPMSVAFFPLSWLCPHFSPLSSPLREGLKRVPLSGMDEPIAFKAACRMVLHLNKGQGPCEGGGLHWWPTVRL